ncbi:MAG: LLM class flavin-dependent oxidoreductase [Proteobacteria bacterium]|nr:LLM class flavin-dependent oxidoreductase [Pseudomonadota bacterium]
MRFGIRLIGYLGASRDLIRLAKLAEDAGFDSVWFPHDTFMHNTWVLTTAAAEATSKIRIATVGTNPYTTNPCEVATYAATLDDLSGGRFILGLGFHTQKMVEWTGIDASDYIHCTREAVDVVRALLHGETVVYKGQHFNWSDQCYMRMPVLRKDLPIYVAAFGSEYLELSGEIGDGSLPMITPPESANYMVSNIRRGLARSGRDGSDYMISGCAWLSLSESRQEAADIMRKMVAYFGPYLEEPALNSIGLSVADMRPLGELIEAGDYEAAWNNVTPEMIKLGITGTPADVIKQVERLAETGIDEVSLGGPLGPDVEKAIALMGKHVIPHFRN